MTKSLRITLTAVVLMSVAQIASATAAPGGTDPHPQSVLSVNEIVAAILSMIGL